MVSWKNPGAAEAQLGWDDYLQDGVIAALEAAEEHWLQLTEEAERASN